LRYAEGLSVEVVDRLYHRIARSSHIRHEWLDQVAARLDEPSDVLQDEVARIQLLNEPCELHQQVVARIVVPLPAAVGEPLAWRAAEDKVDLTIMESPPPSELISREVMYVRSERPAIREVDSVHARVQGIVVGRACDLETGLLEPEGHSTNAAEEVDRGRTPIISVSGPGQPSTLPPR
jgi:hypothetical protein